MNPPITNHPRRAQAFTLLELLVIIAVIGIIAALLFPVAGQIKASAARKKAQTELSLVVLAIEAYKDKLGHYPPDVPNTSSKWPWINQLYYELMGTKLVNNEYVTLDGSSRIADTDAAFTSGYGTVGSKPAIRGFLNCTRGANADEAPAAKTFLSQLKPTQYGETSPGSGIRLLACSVQWPVNHPFQPVPGSNPAGLNPWRYVSSNPTNNPGAFDLWVDIFVGGKTNRISNWSKVPQIVSTPY